MLPRPVSVFSANFNEKAPFADAAPPEPTGMEADHVEEDAPPFANMPPPPQQQQPDLAQRVAELERKIDEMNATFERRIDRMDELIMNLTYRVSQVDEVQFRSLNSGAGPSGQRQSSPAFASLSGDS